MVCILDHIRDSVCKCIKKIASMSKEDLYDMYREMRDNKKPQTDLVDVSKEVWNVQVKETIKLPFLEKMLEVFQVAVKECS